MIIVGQSLQLLIVLLVDEIFDFLFAQSLILYNYGNGGIFFILWKALTGQCFITNMQLE